MKAKIDVDTNNNRRHENFMVSDWIIIIEVFERQIYKKYIKDINNQKNVLKCILIDFLISNLIKVDINFFIFSI